MTVKGEFQLKFKNSFHLAIRSQLYNLRHVQQGNKAKTTTRGRKKKLLHYLHSSAFILLSIYACVYLCDVDVALLGVQTWFLRRAMFVCVFLLSVCVCVHVCVCVCTCSVCHFFNH